MVVKKWGITMLVKEVVMIKRVNYVLFTYFFLTSYDIMMT